MVQNRKLPSWHAKESRLPLLAKILSCAHAVDARNPAPPKKLWNDALPVHTKHQWFPLGFLGGAGFRPSTVWLNRFVNLHLILVVRSHPLSFLAL